MRRLLKADTNTNRVIGFSSSEYLTNGHPETTTTGFNLVPGTYNNNNNSARGA